MTVLLIMLVSLAVLGGGGVLYSRLLAKWVGENPSLPTPAIRLNDGRDYVPSPTPVVFAHHFAAIAGAGPIIGPVIAIVYGWVPALIWVVFGGLFFGAVHDYLAMFMSTREGGQSMATIARRLLGNGVFLALMLFLIVMLALVCAAFLNLSAKALVSMLPFDRIELARDQTLFRLSEVAGQTQVVIGGVASMSVVIITLFAPLVGWMYIKKKIGMWQCSAVSIAVCALSVLVGLYYPIYFPQKVFFGDYWIAGVSLWKIILSVYVLLAAGVPVWIFLQSRDFINAHILYIGLGLLLITLVVAGIKNVGPTDSIPAFSLDQGNKALGFIWPALFINIACGAVSGFHSLAAGGTTSKQITSETAGRRIGYYGMLLETFLAVSVIAVMLVGTGSHTYLTDVHPQLFGLAGNEDNPVLGFAYAVGKTAKLAFGVPVALGALGGMVLLEGFLITTLDAAVRLTRYLFEEVWRVLFGKYDIFAHHITATNQNQSQDEQTDQDIVGGDGIPIATQDPIPEPAFPIATTGLKRTIFQLMRHYWFNSGLAVGMMLLFALTGGQKALWGIFATSNQLLAAMVLSLASLWLFRNGKRIWFTFIPALLMLATTVASLIQLLVKYIAELAKPNGTPVTSLLIADVLILTITVYLVIASLLAARQYWVKAKAD